MAAMRAAFLACAAVLAATACTTTPSTPPPPASRAAIAALAPSGKLKVGLYPGSPTSFIVATDGRPARGVAYDLAGQLAAQAGIAFEPMV